MDTGNRPLTFHSKALDRTIPIDGLSSLTESELQAFNGELVIAARSMENAMSDALRREIETGVPIDYDWTHRVRRKLNICVAFRTNVVQLLKDLPKREPHAPDTESASVRERVDLKFEELLIEEIGERLYRELQQEAIDIVLEDLRRETQAS